MSRNNRQSVRGRTLLAFVILLLIGGGVFFFKGAAYFPSLYELLFKKEIELVQAKDDRINLLLLGIGGGSHDGPLLTDTVIYASIDPTRMQVTLITIPRDLWIPELQQKMNYAYAYGEAKKEGGGLLLAKKVAGKVVGQDIDYGFRVDFQGFIKAVDMIGGLDIQVDRAFDDFEYPVSGKENDTCGFEGEEFAKRATDEAQLEAFPCRYEQLHFDAGLQHMDGDTALKYVRSRHAIGPEGTDFARSKRQEKVINAFKDKVLSAGTLLNPIKLVSLYDIFKGSIDTDIRQEEYDDFVKLARKMGEAKTVTAVLDYGDDEDGVPGLLLNPPIGEAFNYQWVLIPREGPNKYGEISAYVECLIKSDVAEKCLITPTKADN